MTSYMHLESGVSLRFTKHPLKTNVTREVRVKPTLRPISSVLNERTSHKFQIDFKPSELTIYAIYLVKGFERTLKEGTYIDGGEYSLSFQDEMCISLERLEDKNGEVSIKETITVFSALNTFTYSFVFTEKEWSDYVKRLLEFHEGIVLTIKQQKGEKDEED